MTKNFIPVVLWLALSDCAATEANAWTASPEVAQPVRITSPERGSIAVPVRGAGVLGAQRELDLAFKTAGVLAQVLVQAGAHVSKGQLLARLDPTECIAQLERAQQAREKTERDFARYQQLEASGAFPSAQLADARTGLTLARNDLRLAEFNLEHTRLVAPEAGVVDHVSMHAAEIVTAGRPALRMSAGKKKLARIGLVDRDALLVQLGESAKVWLDARPDEPYDAYVSNIASVSSASTGTFTVELTIRDERARELPSGLSLKAEIAHTAENLVRVPLSALVDGQGPTAAVFAVRERRAQRLPVTIRWLTPEAAVLADKLEGVEAIVEAGATRLVDGALVDVFEEK